MKPDLAPVIKFEVEHMKQTLIAHLGMRGSELGDYVSEAMGRAVENYPWEQRVTEIVHSVLTHEIEKYFECGPGKALIAQAVSAGFATMGGGN